MTDPFQAHENDTAIHVTWAKRARCVPRLWTDCTAQMCVVIGCPVYTNNASKLSCVPQWSPQAGPSGHAETICCDVTAVNTGSRSFAKHHLQLEAMVEAAQANTHSGNPSAESQPRLQTQVHDVEVLPCREFQNLQTVLVLRCLWRQLMAPMSAQTRQDELHHASWISTSLSSPPSLKVSTALALVIENNLTKHVSSFFFFRIHSTRSLGANSNPGNQQWELRPVVF